MVILTAALFAAMLCLILTTARAAWHDGRTAEAVLGVVALGGLAAGLAWVTIGGLVK